MGLWPLKNMAHFPDSINAKYWSVWHKLKCLIQLLRSVIKVGVRGNSLASCTSFFLLMRIQKWQMEIKQPSALNRRATRGKESGTLTLRSTTSALEHLLLDHEQRSLVGDSPWGRKESDTTEWLSTLIVQKGLHLNFIEGTWRKMSLCQNLKIKA